MTSTPPPASEIARYDIDRDIFERCQCRICPTDIGDYVLHSDHLAALESARRDERERCAKVCRDRAALRRTHQAEYREKNRDDGTSSMHAAMESYNAEIAGYETAETLILAEPAAPHAGEVGR